MKYCIDKYPKGSFKGQVSDGKYMDGYLHKNLENLADKIVKDMTFLGIIYSSTLEVGTGKSVLATQIGEAWTEIVNKKHNLEIPYSVDNIVWRPKELIERAFQVPKYSFILLDEWEDTHYWSELGMSLRQFFRKCRQLNLFIMCIIPNWFQLNISYAISRSIFAIDVRFNDKLDRGFFAFYNFPSKRMLYVNGKKQHNYSVARPTFMGRFGDGYGVDEAEYRRKKYEDMLKYDEENPEKLSVAQMEVKIKTQIMKNLEEENIYRNEDLAKIFKVSPRTITRWRMGDVSDSCVSIDNYSNELSLKKDFIEVNDGELEAFEKEREDVQEE